MEGNTVRHHITTGKFTLPCTYAFAAALWAFSPTTSQEHWIVFLWMAAITYILYAVYNNVSLIRVRSWLLPSCFIILCAVMPFLHAVSPACFAVTLFLAAQHFLLASYQNIHPERNIFHAFLFLVLGAVFMPQTIFLGIAFFFAMLTFLRAFSLRAFISIFLAILTVTIFSLFTALVLNRMQEFQEHLMTIRDIHFEYVQSWNTQQIVNASFLGTLILISILHYGKTNFNDKIRTRMYFYVIILETLVAIGMLLLYPQYFNELIFVLLTQATPLFAHYMVLGKGRLSDFFFFVILLAIAVLAAYNLWMT